MYPLRKRHKGFLIAFLPTIDMHHRLAFLRRKNMRAAHSKSIRRCCALLEDMALRSQWLVFVEENACILCDSSICLGLGGYGGDEMLGEHGGGDGAGDFRRWELVNNFFGVEALGTGWGVTSADA